MKNNNHSFLILCIAVVLLIIASVVPFSNIYKGYFKDYNLFSDILPAKATIYKNSTTPNTTLDPELIAIINQPDSIYSEEQSANVISNNDMDTCIFASIDSTYIPRQGDTVIIEDYTANGCALLNLRNAIENRSTLGRPVRIAFLGDSYIEGDIFTQHVREQLQDQYGGAGVGFVNMHSDFPGFRRSVKQSSNGWIAHDLLKNNISNLYLTITQQYFKPDGDASSKYRGSDYAKYLDKWESSKFVFISPTATTIQLKSSEDWVTYNTEGNDSIQYIEIINPTNEFSVKVSSPDLIGLGVWLESIEGISVDCMSTRGSSGISLAKINSNMSKQMSGILRYDLIVLEYGINAMASEQTNFNAYTSQMEKVIQHLRTLYTNTDILLMGIGDRGEKYGNEIHSIKNAPIMVNAQRKLAKKMQCAFWDTREAMGGNDAIVRWANHTPPYANKDYIHLSYKGGQALATEFVKSLQHAINE